MMNRNFDVTKAFVRAAAELGNEAVTNGEFITLAVESNYNQAVPFLFSPPYS